LQDSNSSSWADAVEINSHSQQDDGFGGKAVPGGMYVSFAFQQRMLLHALSSSWCRLYEYAYTA
jgi:hypothetical protein